MAAKKPFIPPGGFAGFAQQSVATQALVRGAQPTRRKKKRTTKKAATTKKRPAKRKTASKGGPLKKGSAEAKARMKKLRNMQKKNRR